LNRSFDYELPGNSDDEIILRKAHALIEIGESEKGIIFTKHVISSIKKGLSRRDQMYIRELAYAYFILGRANVLKFMNIKFENSTEILEKKCIVLLGAQSQFLRSIRIGTIYWSNASAFEVAAIYKQLYDEMTFYKIPENLTDEEKSIYKCELWNRISGLLKKSKHTLIKNLEAAEKINEENSYTEKSFNMIIEITNIYDSQERLCNAPGMKSEKE